MSATLDYWALERLRPTKKQKTENNSMNDLADKYKKVEYQNTLTELKR